MLLAYGTKIEQRLAPNRQNSLRILRGLICRGRKSTQDRQNHSKIASHIFLIGETKFLLEVLKHFFIGKRAIKCLKAMSLQKFYFRELVSEVH